MNAARGALTRAVTRALEAGAPEYVNVPATEYDRRGPNDRAEIRHRASERARLTGIPHYILSNHVESWVVGQGAKDNFWAELVPVVSFDRNGEEE